MSCSRDHLQRPALVGEGDTIPGSISDVYDGIVAAGGEVFGETQDAIEDAFGGFQGRIGFGDEGWDVDIGFGEKRVLSWAALLAAVVVGALIGAALR